MSPARVLHLPARVEDELRRWAARAFPVEACGLLIGRADARATRIERATLARNLRAPARADRFEIDPADHLAAWKAAEREGLEVVGAWHSHPDQPAVPSATDRDEAWEGLEHLIVAVRAGRATDVRAWRLVAGAFVERALVREPPLD